MPRWSPFASKSEEDEDTEPVNGAEAAAPTPRPSPDGPPLSELEEARAVQIRLRQDLSELLKAHRQQSRVLERNQKALEETEDEVARHRARVTQLETELGELRKTATQHQARIRELETVIEKHATLQTAYETIDRERQDLTARVADLTRSRANAAAEKDRLEALLAAAHATMAARDAEVAALKVEQETLEARRTAFESENDNLRASNARLKQELEKALEIEPAHHRLRLEFDALSARWDVARAQLAEAEQALKTSQATIKAAQRLTASVEWRTALDGVLDAASELVRFERGTLALVDELQDELKVEAARNSPIAISEMSRFKVGEGIAGWALSHREPVLVRDSRSDPRFKASDPKHQPRSFVAVPLLADKEGLGVLTLARSASDPFTDHDLRNLSRVAQDAANALINARLIDLLKQREDRLSTLVRKARELSQADDIKEVVKFVLASARELVGGRAALLALRSSKTSELEVVGSVGVPDEIVQHRLAWGAPAANDVMRSGKPWVSPMREMLPAALAEQVEKAHLKGLVSVLCGTLAVPPTVDDGALLDRSNVEATEQVSGVLNVYRDSTAPVPSGDLDQLRAFAEQASVAIQNVRRWDKVKEQLQATSSMNTRLMGRERYINQLHYRIQQLEQELSRYKVA